MDIYGYDFINKISETLEYPLMCYNIQIAKDKDNKNNTVLHITMKPKEYKEIVKMLQEAQFQKPHIKEIPRYNNEPFLKPCPVTWNATSEDIDNLIKNFTTGRSLFDEIKGY